MKNYNYRRGTRQVMVALLLLSMNNGVIITTTYAQAPHIELEALPYSYGSLEPIISSTTLEYHHDKHHAKYVVMTNQLLKKDKLKHLRGKPLEDIMEVAYLNQYTNLFNNAAQAWNHQFFWNCMKPPTKVVKDEKNSITTITDQKKPSESYHPTLHGLLVKSFGNVDKFYVDFMSTANTLFGSGWVWLVYDYSTHELVIVKTIGADNPMVFNSSYKPLLVLDVWEHSYYLDYQNRRPEYVEKWMYKLVNWDFVAENLDNALPESKKNNKGSTSSDDGGEEQKKEAATTTDEEDEL